MLLFGLRAAVALATVAYLVPRVSAQNLPNGTITLVVGNGAGGIADVTARMYAEALSRNIGRTVVVENRPAGGEAAAAVSVKNSPPDGRTLLVYPGTQLAALPVLQQVPYDPLKDFEPVTTLFDLLNFIAVPPDSPANTIPELLDYWKRNPNGLRVGSAGFGSPAHFNSVILSLDNALPIMMVQYRGSAALMPDLIRPDRNVTSMSALASEMGGKRVELLKDIIPRASRVAVLWNPDNKSKVAEWNDTQTAAKTIGLSLISAKSTPPRRLKERSVRSCASAPKL